MLEPQVLEGSAVALLTANTEPKMEASRTHLCTLCKKPRHTKERCWKLHGKPPSQELGNQGAQSYQQRPNWGAKPNQPGSQVYLTEFQPPYSEQKGNLEEQRKESFNHIEIEKIRGFVDSLDKPSSVCSLVFSGNSICSFHSKLLDHWL